MPVTLRACRIADLTPPPRVAGRAAPALHPRRDFAREDPGSADVERELQHAFEGTKEVYVVWKPKKSRSPFITETATKIFPTVEAALSHFESHGMFGAKNLFGH